MTINVGEHFEKMMHDLVAGGRFRNQSEAVRAGLRLLEKREYGRDEQLEAELRKRLDAPARRWTKNDRERIRKIAEAQRKRERAGTAA